MRALLIVGLVTLTGCATRPGSNSIEWNLINAHPNDTPAPTVEEGNLVLSGRAVRSSKTYTAPVSIECELQPQPVSTNSVFYIDLVPESQSAAALPVDYLGIKLVHGQALYVWASQGSQPTSLIAPTPVNVPADGGYKLSVEVRHDGLTVTVNGATIKVDKTIPFDEFRIELRTFPPPSSWRVAQFSIR